MVTTASFLTAKRNLLDKLAGSLVRVKESAVGVTLALPVLFPSGSHVTVVVRAIGSGRYLVTDDGAASFEAELMGSTGSAWTRAGREAAERNGIRFNDHELFEIDAPEDRLPGYVAIVADTARLALEIAARRYSEKLERETRTNVYDLLVEAFGKESVVKEPTITGASTHAWEFDALVTGPHAVAFSVISPAAVSVSSAYMKFDDVRRAEDPPRVAAVLTKRNAFRPDQLTILNRVAKLVDLTASKIDLCRLAA